MHRIFLSLFVWLATGTVAAAADDVLSRVRQAGIVRCAVDMTPGFSQISGRGDVEGFDIDFCRAVAAAVLGDASRFAIQRITTANKFRALAAGDVDLAFGMSTWTLTRDTMTGTHFPAVIFNDGEGFLVWNDSGIKNLSDAKKATICVQSQTTTIDTLKNLLPRLGLAMTLIEQPSSEEKWFSFAAHKCALVIGDRSELAGRRSTMASDPKRWVILPDIISREPLGPVVTAGDDRWFSIVRWVVLVTQIAEARDVASTNIDSVADGADIELKRLIGHDPDFGKSLGLDPQWAQRVVRQVGNYAEIYDRNLGPNTPIGLERGLNALWNKGGLFYPPPLL